MTALRSPHLLPALRFGGSGSTLTGKSPHFDVPVVQETLDSAANRCIAALARNVLHRTTRLKLELGELVEKENPSKTRTALSARWSRREDFLGRIEYGLRRLQKISPLSDVTRPAVSAAGLNAISADPAYSSAYGLGWRILRLGADGPPQPERLWISPTWEIYERWCFVQIGNDLKRNYKDYDWSVTLNPTSNAKAAFTGSKHGGRKIDLLLQSKFPAWDQSPNDCFRSVSGQREPDIVLKLDDGRKHALVCVRRQIPNRTKECIGFDGICAHLPGRATL